MEASRRDSDDLLVGLTAGVDRLDGEAVGVLQQARHIPEPLRDREPDDPVPAAALVIHVDDRQGKALVELRAEEQSPVVHGVAEDRVERIVVHAGPALVAGEDQERLGGPLLARRVAVELDLRDRRTRPAHVAGRRIHEQVLARPVEAGRARLLRGGEERIPGEAVDLPGPDRAGMAHDQRDIVAGVGNEAIQEQMVPDGVAEPLARRFQHAARGPGVPPDGPDVRLDDRQRDLHVDASSETGPRTCGSLRHPVASTVPRPAPSRPC
jgi:hypothetical protein